MARSDTNTTGREGERIPLARLTPGGPGATDALGWCARGAAVLLLLAIAWLVYAGVRPLGPVSEAESPRVRAARDLDRPVLTVSERTALLTAVTRSNWYSPERRMWTVQDQKALAAASAEGAGEPGDATTPGADAGGPLDDRPGSIRVTAKEDLPDKLARAFENLDLKGIRSTAEGGMVAMITFVKSPTRPATTPFAVGDTFTDESFAGEPWKVVLIDAAFDRVFLRREGQTVVLPLFSGSSAVVAEVEGEVEAEVDPGAVGESREEVVAQLRAAGISDDEIRELLRMAEADEVAGAPDEEDEAMERAAEALTEHEDAEGMAGVLEMMKSAKPTVRPVETPESERPGSYEATGRGHVISGIDAVAGVVTLEDGSRWTVSTGDAEKLAKWPSGAPVSVYAGRRVGRAYVIVNEANREYAAASHIVEKETP